MTQAPPTLSGTLLGGVYRVGRLLGEGSMGTVYEGLQEALGRPVAIKVLKSRGGVAEADLERFGREARSAAALGHPNIVQVTDFRPDLNPPFLVMERLVGESLREAMAREKRLPTGRVALVGTQLLDALAAAHRAGIVHRDVKPDNVFLTKMAGVADIVKVLDFGVAKLTNDRRLTAFGAMMGSPAYMAPEQATGGAVDHRADIWSVGATLYHALSGRLPFDAKSLPELLAWLSPTGAPHRPITELVPGLDPRMVAVIDRALAKDPAARFASASEMQAALEPLLHANANANANANAPTPAAAVAHGSAPTLPIQPALGSGPHEVAPVDRGSYANLPRGSAPSFPVVPTYPTASTVPRNRGNGMVWPVVVGAFAVLVLGGLAVVGVAAGLGIAGLPGDPSPATSVARPAGAMETAPVAGPVAPHLPKAWAELSVSVAKCQALRIAPFANGRAGEYRAFPLAEAKGLGSQLAGTVDGCTVRCDSSPWERYTVRIAYDGTVTEARVPKDASRCPARDDCIDKEMREYASIDPPPDGRESVVELVCTFGKVEGRPSP